MNGWPVVRTCAHGRTPTMPNAGFAVLVLPPTAVEVSERSPARAPLFPPDGCFDIFYCCNLPMVVKSWALSV